MAIVNLRSLHIRRIGFHIVFLGAITTMFGVYLHISLQRYLVSALELTLERRATQIEADVEKKLAQGNEQSRMTQLIGDITMLYAPEENDRFIRITRSDHKILYVSGTPGDRSFDPGAVPLVAMDSPQWRKVQGAGGAGDALYVAMMATPPQASGYRYGVEVGASDAQIKNALHGLTDILLLGLPAFLLVAAVGAYILIRRALTPVTEVVNAAEEISILNLGNRLPVVPTGDVLEHLSKALNRMIGRLDAAFWQISRFTADASHELRTPLTVIKGGLESILKAEPLKPALREQLVSILEETDRLIAMTSGLLAIARLEVGEAALEKRVLDLGRLIEGTAEQMQLLAEERKITLTVAAQAGVMVNIDPVRIKEVIINLLDNAFRYTPEGGGIALTVEARDDKAILCVKDTGIGISQDDLPYIFDRFYRARKVRSHGGGTGLGLSIARSICIAHGGEISAASVEGHGSCFTVTLRIAGV